MSKLLLETIRCEHGRLYNLEWHAERMARSCRAVFGKAHPPDIRTIAVPAQAAEGLFKCRVLYDAHIHQVTFTPYSIRPVKMLKLVRADALDYMYKYASRSAIQTLFDHRGSADDILMVKNGLITDTSYANIALFDGSAWYTPATPLLAGTRRAALLEAGRLRADDISPQALSRFREVRLINAMMSLDEGPRLHPRDIIQLRG